MNKPALVLTSSIRAIEPLSVSDLALLMDVSSMLQLKKGSLLLNESAICKQVFFVEQGYLRTYINKDGNEINTDFTFEGQFTTNLKSLRLQQPSDTSIIAAENCVVHAFDKNKLLDLYSVSPAIESFGRKLLEQLLMEQEEHTNWYKLYTPSERYFNLVEKQPHYLQRISLTQLASYLGMARETLSRIRKQH